MLPTIKHSKSYLVMISEYREVKTEIDGSIKKDEKVNNKTINGNKSSYNDLDDL
jgi:hypothetical protein